TFDPVFDNTGAMGIGDFALSQTDPNLLYVGTGEKIAVALPTLAQVCIKQ
ncbi:MAG: hypothetical protein HC811_10255, partial [Flammeovirgaceae bacterium]|nr:hypothetical protein [Flammeovirgaceae bacterium]